MENTKWRQNRDKKMIAYIDRQREKLGLTNAYWKAVEKFSLSYPTVQKIYQAAKSAEVTTAKAE